jgi:hypothetical protein
MRKSASILALVALITGIIVCLVCLQNRLSALSATRNIPASMAFVPESEKIRPMFLGFEKVYADYLWIKTTIYFGGHIMTDRRFPWLVRMVDIVTKLNPGFYPAYEFGGLILPKFCDNPDAARVILQRGVSCCNDKKWKLYFYLGMLYFEKYSDPVKAAMCVATASQLPGAPQIKLESLATALYNKAPDAEKKGRFLELLYGASENPEVRRHLMSIFQTKS